MYNSNLYNSKNINIKNTKILNNNIINYYNNLKIIDFTNFNINTMFEKNIFIKKFEVIILENNKKNIIHYDVNLMLHSSCETIYVHDKRKIYKFYKEVPSNEFLFETSFPIIKLTAFYEEDNTNLINTMDRYNIEYKFYNSTLKNKYTEAINALENEENFKNFYNLNLKNFIQIIIGWINTFYINYYNYINQNKIEPFLHKYSYNCFKILILISESIKTINKITLLVNNIGIETNNEFYTEINKLKYIKEKIKNLHINYI